MRSGMPYTFGLARRFGYAADYVGVAYPSLPNYIAITSGSTHGITDDGSPAAHALAGPSVFGEAVAAGKTATVCTRTAYRRAAPSPTGDGTTP